MPNDDALENPGDQQASRRLAYWSMALPAVLGLIGGGLSGWFSSYVTLSTKREEHSIERARAFRELMRELGDEKTSRLAVLNLWQLYPEERDRRVITAAAFAVNQPDLVELVSGIDAKVNPVADMLHVRALSDNPDIQIPALRTLINVHPARAAGVLIDGLSQELEGLNGKLPHTPSGFNPELELVRLTTHDDTVAAMVADKTEGQWSLFFDYMLYRAGRPSAFIETLVAGYEGGAALDLMNDYLHRGRFKAQDRAVVIAAAGGYVATSFAREDRDDFALVDVLSALKNGDFYGQLGTALPVEVTEALAAAVSRPDEIGILRKRALELLDLIAPKEAVLSLTMALLDEGQGSALSGAAERMLSPRNLTLVSNGTTGAPPPDCGEMASPDCLSAKPAVWQAWLAQHQRVGETE
ncbi:MAG: hypothetical protein AAGF79_12125 [Pseudomonadota bacterium]